MVCSSAEETANLARGLAAELQDGANISLSGGLGSGKTTFAKGLAQGLGVESSVKSPSFNVCSIYSGHGGRAFVHVDAYRLTGAEDFENLLIDELVSEDRILCVEWPEAVREALDENCLHIKIESVGEFARKIILQ